MIFEDKHHRYIQTLTYATGLCWLCCMLSSLSLVITFISQTSQIAFAFGITTPQHWRWDEGFSSAAHSNGSCQGCGHGRLGREKCSRMSGVEFQSNQRWSRSELELLVELQFAAVSMLPYLAISCHMPFPLRPCSMPSAPWLWKCWQSFWSTVAHCQFLWAMWQCHDEKERKQQKMLLGHFRMLKPLVWLRRSVPLALRRSCGEHWEW